MDKRELLEDLGLVYDGAYYYEDPQFDSAIIGATNDGRVVYAYGKMVASLQEQDGMTEEDAKEFIGYNTLGATGNDFPYPVVVFMIDE